MTMNAKYLVKLLSIVKHIKIIIPELLRFIEGSLALKLLFIIMFIEYLN